MDVCNRKKNMDFIEDIRSVCINTMSKGATVKVMKKPAMVADVKMVAVLPFSNTPVDATHCLE